MFGSAGESLLLLLWKINSSDGNISGDFRQLYASGGSVKKEHLAGMLNLMGWIPS